MEINNSAPAKKLYDLIENGEFSHRKQIPSERKLSEKLGISRNEVRKALAVLKSENKIWRHVGKGTFVGPKPNPEDDIRLTGVTNTTNPSEIMETRLVIEPKIVSLAALRASANELIGIENCLNESEPSDDFQRFEDLDERFHLALAESSHNHLLISLYQIVSNLRQDRIWGRLKIAAMNKSRQSEYQRQHQEILMAIKNRNPSGAEKSMRNHLENVQKNLLNVL